MDDFHNAKSFIDRFSWRRSGNTETITHHQLVGTDAQLALSFAQVFLGVLRVAERLRNEFGIVVIGGVSERLRVEVHLTSKSQ